MSNKFIVPIQINGNINSDLKPSNGSLLERELYINKKGYLYYGTVDDSGNKVTRCITVEQSDKSKESDVAYNIGDTKITDYSYPITINYKDSNKFARIGYVNINNDINKNTNENIWKGKIKVGTTDVQTVLDQFVFRSVQKLILSSNGELYGDNPDNVKDPVVGQVYFRI